ncbi:short-chain dehydrogenase [Gluconacetobacter sacchari DSM 12717]|uniref:SDR family oxidoreductase n=2 Tax=Gluconacetobacter sacchari TaxID=92759 RepID=A0A7W4IE14_9PROT|nr:SDR family oxidoreductase [Gluconacetobacter sacchari]MBB2161133.1 SDR family oxidoreductase [Gluconacetobacter sacchari]GBQ23352.1 short-chain dehydrogenase [Gluconacetobacter sacchari DSM 12717]
MTETSRKTALVTGASSGIGAAYADRLARRGYDLVLVARNVERMEELARRLTAETSRKVDVVGADLTKSQDVARVEDRLRGDSAIDLLVNNAGMALTGSVLTAPAADVERLIALNVTAPTRLATAAGNAFAERGQGAIVNVASVLALVSELLDGAYNGSKAYLLTFSRWLGLQLGPKGVYVQALLPAVTRTEVWERSGMDIGMFPPQVVMDVYDLVDAALVGFDRREDVTIPPLVDEDQWKAYDKARLALQPGFQNGTPAPRYRLKVSP